MGKNRNGASQPMTRILPLAASLSGPDLDAIVSGCAAAGFLPNVPPALLKIDQKKQKAGASWRDALAGATEKVFARWPDRGDSLIVNVYSGIVKLERPAFALDPDDFVTRLAGVPFHLAAFHGIYEEWTRRGSNEAPEPVSFADAHFPHGWGAAFRREGHDRLVSRRWLEHGPWRLHRGDGDTSLIQFHDLDADAATARAQAAPGHRRLGISEVGGFIQSGFPCDRALARFYEPDRRRLRIPIYGREVSPYEMLVTRATVKEQGLGPGMPLESAVYVFAEESEGRAHLHELWLRELDCLTFVDGVETRLTDDYTPEAPNPGWGQRAPSF